MAFRCDGRRERFFVQTQAGSYTDRLLRQQRWLTVERLPGYAPELNFVEPVRGNVKRTELANFCAADLEPDRSAHRPQILERRRWRAEHPSLTEQFEDIRGVEAPLDEPSVLQVVADALADEHTVEGIDVSDSPTTKTPSCRPFTLTQARVGPARYVEIGSLATKPS